jgi:hypothetical protein
MFPCPQQGSWAGLWEQSAARAGPFLRRDSTRARAADCSPDSASEPCSGHQEQHLPNLFEKCVFLTKKYEFS